MADADAPGEVGRDGLVDWRFAERTAAAVAGDGGTGFEAAAVRVACAEAIEVASAYARLPVPDEWAVAELVDRPAWSRNALASLAAAAAPVEARLAAQVRLPGPLGGLVRTVVGAGAGAEAGIVVGYAARHVLGQYDIAVIGPQRPARLLFVGPNIEAVCSELGTDRDLFLRWIALHETTHVLQLEGVPWLAPHLRGLLERLLDGAGGGIEPRRLAALAKRFVRDPRELFRELMRGELARLLAGPEEQVVLDRLQATMAVIEGHAEHVMDACVADDPRLGELRERLDRRRAHRGGLGEIAARLIGLDVKLRQYELGRRFWEVVVDECGEAALELPWRSPEALPDLDEIERPREWLARAGAPRVVR